VPMLVDTGVLYALADRSDVWHRRSVDWLTATSERLLIPVTVLPEVCYLLHTRLGAGAERAFVNSVVAGEMDIEALRDRELHRASELLDRYPQIGFVDATVVAIAERLKLTRIATTDRRHFASVVPSHTAAFELVP
jgi:predicted nucleic acid-binding protein